VRQVVVALARTGRLLVAHQLCRQYHKVSMLMGLTAAEEVVVVQVSATMDLQVEVE
jgi:hypothetical protein